MQFGPLAKLSFGVWKSYVGFFSVSYHVNISCFLHKCSTALCDWFGKRHRTGLRWAVPLNIAVKVQLCPQICPLFAVMGNKATNE